MLKYLKNLHKSTKMKFCSYNFAPEKNIVTGRFEKKHHDAS